MRFMSVNQSCSPVSGVERRLARPRHPNDAPVPDKPTGARAEPVASGLVNPWGLAILPSGDLLVTERPGRIRYITSSGNVSPPSKVPQPPLPPARAECSTSPSPRISPQSRNVFIGFTERRYVRTNGTSVARLELTGEGDGRPPHRAKDHLPHAAGLLRWVSLRLPV